ncbi:MAG: hypothetical protein ABMA64_16975 [Myxococcota bacterium]
MANRTVANLVPAMVVVGLGMLLIAGLSGIVLWLVTRRRHAAVAAAPAVERLSPEAAEA